MAPYWPMVGWILALAALALTLALGIILVFHWFRFAMNPAGAVLALIVYISVSSAFLIMVFGSLLIFVTSL